MPVRATPQTAPVMPVNASAGRRHGAERGRVERHHERVALPEAERALAAHEGGDLRACGGDIGYPHGLAAVGDDGCDELVDHPWPSSSLQRRWNGFVLGSGSVARPSSQLAPGPKARANGPERAPARAEAR